MINTWWVTRPKRKLNSVPEVLATLVETSLNMEWDGQRETHLSLEEALESNDLKRKGDRRDHTGGGGRTYKAWISSLGLIFIQESTQTLKLTLAGEALMRGDPPVAILKNQILKYQFPSSFSLSRGVNVSPRFKIRPFKFLLKLLIDSRIDYLTEEEIAKIVITEAENETEKCYEKVVDKLCLFRNYGDTVLDEDFFEKYAPKTGKVNPEHPFSHLLDIANTIINWVEYTQLAKRDEDHKLRILSEKRSEALQLVVASAPLIDRPYDQEYFQRKYGVDPNSRKDTRNLSEEKTITSTIIDQEKIRRSFVTASLKEPISKITSSLIEKISVDTGLNESFVEATLFEMYPHGAIGAFMSNYFEMAYKGRDEATEFEKATVQIFNEVFGFKAYHIGPIGLTPDVLALSDEAGFAGIIDNKAYSKYSISNDHHNRMVHNYIENFKSYSKTNLPLEFFSYIAGGFGSNIDAQINNISKETGIKGSAITVSGIISMVERQQIKKYTHKDLLHILSLNRKINVNDL